MARREDFDNSLWSDPEFLALSSDARLLYIWTWTNPRCGMAGIYKLAPAQAAYEIGLSERKTLAAFVELGEARFAYYEEGVVWVRTRVRHLRQRTKQIATSIRGDLDRVSDSHPLKGQFIKTYEGLQWLYLQVSTEPRTTLYRDSSETLGSEAQSSLNGYGYGNGSGRKGRGAGRGRRPSASVPGYEPSAEWTAVRDEHFPGHDVSTIESTAAALRFRRVEPTVEAIRALVEDRPSLEALPEAS